MSNKLKYFIKYDSRMSLIIDIIRVDKGDLLWLQKFLTHYFQKIKRINV